MQARRRTKVRLPLDMTMSRLAPGERASVERAVPVAQTPRTLEGLVTVTAAGRPDRAA
jgi:hypothetical protein